MAIVLGAVLAGAPVTATADDYDPVSYVEGVVSAPPGTRLDRLQVQLTDVQSTLTRLAVSVGPDGRFKVPYSWMDFANLKVLGGDTGLADTWYGNVARQEEATTLALASRNMMGLDVTMAAGSAVSGRISVPASIDVAHLSVVAESMFTGPGGMVRTATERTAAVAADGSYSISGLGANTYTVRVRPGGSGLLETWYGSGADKGAATSLPVTAGSGTQGVNITMTQPASLSGKAVFPAGTTPEPGFVRVYSDAGNVVATASLGADGSYSLPQVPSGPARISYGISATNGSFATMWHPNSGQFATAGRISFSPGEVKTGLDLLMAPAGAISGTVTGTGGASVYVGLLDSLGRHIRSATTDSAGNYVLGNAGPGAYKVRFTEPWQNGSSLMTQYYPGVSESAGYQAGADVAIARGQTTSGINAAMTPGGSITGIIEEVQGTPLESHSVKTIYKDGTVAERHARTDRSGAFVIGGLADGDYILETNVEPYAHHLIPLGRIYSGNVRDRQKAATISIRNGAPVNAGTLSYATAGQTASPAAGKFVPVTPTRILDTRDRFQPVPSNTSQTVQVSGTAGIPADASAVALNVTVTEPTSDGFVSAFPFGQQATNTSNVNFRAGQTLANSVVVPLNNGKITLAHTGYDGTAHLVADVSGYFTGGLPTDNGAYRPVNPFRAADSRPGVTPAGQVLDVQMTGLAPLPADVGAVVVNITAARVWDGTTSTSFGYLTAYASGTPRPGTSNLNYDWIIGDTPNLAVVPVGADGKISIANTSRGPVGIVVDVMGYFRKGAGSSAGAFESLTPTRLADTRTASSAVGPNKDLSVPVTGAHGIPAGAKAALINLTVTEPSSFGHLRAYASGGSLPGTSTLNYDVGQTRANFAVVPIGADGKIAVRNTSSGQSHVIVDIVGYIRG